MSGAGALLRERSFWLLVAAMVVVGAVVLALVPTPFHLPVSALLFWGMTDVYHRRRRRT